MDLKLVYVNKIGFNFKGNIMYEFIFSDANKVDRLDVYGDGWEEEPASGYASPPDDFYVHALGKLDVKDYELMCAGDNDYYSVLDARDGVIALAYELIDDTFVKYPRLCFHYWEDLESVKEKLLRRKIVLDVLTNEDEEDVFDDEFDEEDED